MLPFQALGRPSRLTLTADRFKPAAQVLGVLSTVAYFDGPLGRLMLFKGGEGFRFFVKGRHEVGVAGGTPAGVLVVDLGAAGHDVIRSPRPASAFPTQAHPDVLAFTSSDGGTTWLPANVTAVDFDANTVSVDRPGNATRVAVYFTTGKGEVELRVSRPLGSDTARAMLFGGAMRAFHETDQTNSRSAPTFGADGREYPLPQQFRLELAVRSTTPVVFDQYAQHELSLPVWDVPVRVLDAAQMNAQAELKLRGGTL